MSNTLIVEEDSQEIGDLDSLSKSLSEPVETVAPVADVVDAVKPDWCPDKFWNAETGVVDNERMASSYLNLESSYGQRGNEVGELRKLSDEFLGLKRQVDLMGESEPADKPAEAEAISATDLLERPREILDGLVRDALAEHEDKEAATAAEVDALENETSFYTKYPDYESTATSPEFRDWASQSRARSRLMSHAAAGDLGAAGDLLDEYAESTADPVVTDDDPTVDPLERARAVALESGNASATTGTESKKTYRRADLIKLKMERPDEYALNEREILQAYHEKRVT
jgi:hypothetical protein